MTAELAGRLVRETGAAPGDPVPGAVAWQLGSLHSMVLSGIGRRTAAGQRPDVIAAKVLELIDAVEELMGERLLGYAVREE